jgi:hypothetical protein
MRKPGGQCDDVFVYIEWGKREKKNIFLIIVNGLKTDTQMLLRAKNHMLSSTTAMENWRLENVFTLIIIDEHCPKL